MPEYDRDFAAKLAEVADQTDQQDHWGYDARRVVIYLSRLSAEITMKALLEKAGVPLPQIRVRNHDLRALLGDLDRCEVQVEAPIGCKQWVSASCVRNVNIDLGLAHVPIGPLIDGDGEKISRYPNQIRYGEYLIDFDPGLVAQMAILLSKWAKENWETIRCSP